MILHDERDQVFLLKDDNFRRWLSPSILLPSLCQLGGKVSQSTMTSPGRVRGVVGTHRRDRRRGRWPRWRHWAPWWPWLCWRGWSGCQYYNHIKLFKPGTFLFTSGRGWWDWWDCARWGSERCEIFWKIVYHQQQMLIHPAHTHQGRVHSLQCVVLWFISNWSLSLLWLVLVIEMYFTRSMKSESVLFNKTNL